MFPVGNKFNTERSNSASYFSNSPNIIDPSFDMHLRVFILVIFICHFRPFAGPILEFKGSVQHVQKGHPTLVTQVDLILQN